MSHDSLLRVSKAANMTFLRSGPDTFSITQRARDCRRRPCNTIRVWPLPGSLVSLSLLSRLSEDNVEQGRSRHRFDECCSPSLPLLTQRPLSVIYDVVVWDISSHVLHDKTSSYFVISYGSSGSMSFFDWFGEKN